ncbi:MAG: hypothetical protein LBD25_05090 [Coriobacteriales bacterium]|jgi:Fe-S-cluster-containing dehydrogenase component|nr:hypothetical protein [Coriobacteriales bacterium]
MSAIDPKTQANEYGLLIDYEFCTNCHTCEVACKKVQGLTVGQFGIKTLEDGPRKLPDGSWEWTYLPLPTDLCDLCAARVAEGRLPSCVHHCQSGVMYFGPLPELAKKLAEKPKQVLFSR